MFKVFTMRNMIEEIKIRDMRTLINPHFVLVEKKSPIDSIAKTFIANQNLKSVYVLDENLKLVGKITLKNLIKNEFINLIPNSFKYLDALEFIGNKTAEELMTTPVYIKDNDTLKTAFIKMHENDLEELPVVDENLHLIGNINLIELLAIVLEKKEQKANNNYLPLDIHSSFQK